MEGSTVKTATSIKWQVALSSTSCPGWKKHVLLTTSCYGGQTTMQQTHWWRKKKGGGVQQFSYHVTKIGKWYKVRVISSAQNTPANVCVNMLTKTTYQVEMAIFTCTSTQYQKHWMAHRLSFSEPHWADVNQCFMWTEVALKGTIRTTQNFTRFKNLPGQNSPCANSNKKFNQISYLSKETTMAPRLLL